MDHHILSSKKNCPLSCTSLDIEQMKIVLSKLFLNLSCYLCQFFCLMTFLCVTQPGEITSRRSSTELAHVWNKAVDETLGRLVVYLSSRGW